MTKISFTYCNKSSEKKVKKTAHISNGKLCVVHILQSVLVRKVELLKNKK